MTGKAQEVRGGTTDIEALWGGWITQKHLQDPTKPVHVGGRETSPKSHEQRQKGPPGLLRQLVKSQGRGIIKYSKYKWQFRSGSFKAWGHLFPIPQAIPDNCRWTSLGISPSHQLQLKTQAFWGPAVAQSPSRTALISLVNRTFSNFQSKHTQDTLMSTWFSIYIIMFYSFTHIWTLNVFVKK